MTLHFVCKTRIHQLATESLPFNASKLKASATTLTGTITFTLEDDEGEARKVAVTFDAQRLGDFLAGTFKTTINDETTTGPFRGIYLPLETPAK